MVFALAPARNSIAPTDVMAGVGEGMLGLLAVFDANRAVSMAVGGGEPEPETTLQFPGVAHAVEPPFH